MKQEDAPPYEGCYCAECERARVEDAIAFVEAKSNADSGTKTKFNVFQHARESGGWAR